MLSFTGKQAPEESKRRLYVAPGNLIVAADIWPCERRLRCSASQVARHLMERCIQSSQAPLAVGNHQGVRLFTVVALRNI
jgi:hypothetical protein